MNAQLDFFYKFRTQTTQWHRNGIKNLKFTECEREQDSIVPQLDFSQVNHDEIDGLTVRKEIMTNVRDIGVQCDPIDTNDQSTSTSDLQLSIQYVATANQETNGECAGNRTECRVA